MAKYIAMQWQTINLHEFYTFRNGTKVALVGEMSKIVPQSPQRMRSVSISTDDIIVELVGVLTEHLDFTVFYDNGNSFYKAIQCDFPDSGSVTVSAANMICQWRKMKLCSHCRDEKHENCRIFIVLQCLQSQIE